MTGMPAILHSLKSVPPSRPSWLRRIGFGIVCALALLGVLIPAVHAADLPSVALHYGKDAPLAAMKAFDIAVVEPDHGFDPLAYRGQGGSELFAYVSVGEVHPTRSYAARIPDAWRIGRNATWHSLVIDQAQPAWPAFFADEVVGPLWARGYRGFFLDTLDSYHLVKDVDVAAQQRGLVAVVRMLRKRYPGIRLIFNRGFELLPELRGEVHAVAAESLYRGWDAKRKRYVEMPANDREWLLGQLQTARDRYGVIAIAIDYVAPAARELARDTARRIHAHGIVPYVTDGDLKHLGVGLVEVLPRKLMFLYNSREAARVNVSSPHRYAEMPVNHLGYVAEYVDVTGPLPESVPAGEYAGAVLWFDGYVPGERARALMDWMVARIAEGTRLAVFGSFGFEPDADFLRAAGLAQAPPAKGRLDIALRDPAVGFETPAIPDRGRLQRLRVEQPDARVLLSLNDSAGNRYDAVAQTAWGGFALHPFAVRVLPLDDAQTRWVIEPFAFIRDALALPALPVPDTTTLTGRRMFFAHIDGDGFASRAEMKGRRLAAEVLLEDVLKRYRVPHAMSVIEIETSERGPFARDSAEMEAVARRMFALPHVEIASHSYTHPFYWDSVERGEAKEAAQGYSLAPAGYTPSLEREIAGSVDYIRSRLAPPGKPVGLMLWTGDAAPTEAALEWVERLGMVQMNGGYTVASTLYPSLAAVSSLGTWQGRYFHVHAPIMNENVYTNLWTGPYYGFERVTQTLAFTETPRRLKPVNLYFHTYSASKPASLAVLHKVYRHALAQPVHPVYPSEYVRIAMNFNDVVLARTLDGGRYLVRNATHLRTLRLPRGLGLPDIGASSGIGGWRDGMEGPYVHLTGETATLVLGDRADATPVLAEANARLESASVEQGVQRYRLNGHVPLEFALSGASQCRVTADGRALGPVRSEAGLTHFRLDAHAATIELRCRVG